MYKKPSFAHELTECSKKMTKKTNVFLVILFLTTIFFIPNKLQVKTSNFHPLKTGFFTVLHEHTYHPYL